MWSIEVISGLRNLRKEVNIIQENDHTLVKKEEIYLNMRVETDMSKNCEKTKDINAISEMRENLDAKDLQAVHPINIDIMEHVMIMMNILARL
jgi:hypothetical protein